MSYLINYMSYIVQIYLVYYVCIKRRSHDITINLHDGNHGNQIILEMLTSGFVGHPMENLIHICLSFIVERGSVAR